MNTLSRKYKDYFSQREFRLECIKAALLLIVSLVVNFYAGLYATARASNSVSDIILSNLPVYNIDGTFIWATFAFWTFVILLCLTEPKRIPFVLNAIATFTIIRSGFISLTHLGPYPTQTAIDSYILSFFVFDADLFFSGHTGMPFLFALMFWEERVLRYLFIVMALAFGTIVLLAHLHYSIDVASAFFITYAIYHITEYLFPKDKLLFEKGL
ncbi:hypothetical protein A2662_03215 [Candidatus Giovannonibacteria bacterium RIFCSPHIGHO2_01_FULL_45_33]|uniref:Sphingomyelin synthase-like domain-containing protein n=1 Tax=Candidatus Giovannonibacteria bacterium RIFCSPLOWO2_01_FULL_45_34 TaxID=1798351 RepID=A0A1F5WZQ4_9BACT|nr:MAG: hypothetical protein A2662_03215 [Candidatus Giovannonibacteria bacterium RIFCSPHIGHO2_01_FULL_45_33]OGF69523.1 MAG: hypothetical protein A3C73_04950 [Candidatus Giovannonibacteria bacterium RIFCSPHIGHO2_02_FULL_44_11]OGF81083.1 MAG: hypothetical protein A2930_00740 [Candidatus Giovannonibacteria bacterium RIFCSPLOWO2_01_FULL_45_34]